MEFWKQNTTGRAWRNLQLASQLPDEKRATLYAPKQSDARITVVLRYSLSVPNGNDKSQAPATDTSPAAPAKNQKERRLAAMPKTFGLCRDKEIFPRDGLEYEREMREEW